jgi:pimeloyl-ACP methyl ester carboxylesterase
MAEELPYTSHRYRSACGRLELFARDYPGEGTPLLLMHGLTRNGADFEPLAAHLAGRFRLVVPDQRGRGLSQWDPDPGNYRPDVYSADMFALLDSLGIERAGLIGTSMGGLMAMIMSAMQPARVTAVVLNDIGPHINAGGLARIQGYVSAASTFADWQQAAERCAEVNGQAFPDYGPADWLAFARRTCHVEAGGLVRLAYDPAIASGFDGEAGMVAPPDLWPLWQALGNRHVLAIRGALSDLFSAETLKEMEMRHTGTFASLTVANRGHAPMLDEPEVLETIVPFLMHYAG